MPPAASVAGTRSSKTAGIDFELTLPHVAFHRQIGEFANMLSSPAGEILTRPGVGRQARQMAADMADGDFIQSLMKPVREAGQYASWIAPPRVGIDNKPGDFEYVKISIWPRLSDRRPARAAHGDFAAAPLPASAAAPTDHVECPNSSNSI